MAKGLIDDLKLTSIANAIREKRQSTDLMTVDQMPDQILAIPTGGTSEPISKGVVFIDYDGATVEQYSTGQAMCLTELPAAPDYSSDSIPLTFEGWNWTLEEIISYLTDYPEAILYVGAVYKTTDNKLHMVTELLPAGTEIKFNYSCGERTLSVNWGDGQSDTNDSTSEGSFSHSYSEPGSFHIVIGASSPGAELTLSLYNTINNWLSQLHTTSNFTFRNGFYNLRKLKKLTIAEGILPESLSSYFNSLYSLDTIVIPHMNCSFRQSFQYSYGLHVLSNPYHSTIGESSFYCNETLEAMNYPIDGNNTAINNQVFYLCKSLKSITIPKNTTYIGNSCFYQTSIRNLILPEGLQTIYANAFTQCRYLTEISFPSTITSIGDSAFYCNTKLSVIKFMGETPPSIGESNFEFCNAIVIPPSTECEYLKSDFFSKRRDLVIEDLIITSFKNVSVTADDVYGYDTHTQIHFLAVVDGHSLDGSKTYENLEYRKEVTSDSFGQNTSSTEERSIPITYSFKGNEYQTTITQGPYSERTISFDETHWKQYTAWNGADTSAYFYYSTTDYTRFGNNYLAVTISGFYSFRCLIKGYTYAKLNEIPTSDSYDFKIESYMDSFSSKTQECLWNNLDPEQTYTIYFAHSVQSSGKWYSANVLIPKIPA